jgi:membrane-anchored protein YejM (alkaline phosphatase superfamily)
MSGMNLLETSANSKYGNDSEYKKYKSETSILIPIPNSIYSKIPESIRRTFLLDFKMYN